MDLKKSKRDAKHSQHYEQNAKNSDSGLETQLSNWQVFDIWDARLQQMGWMGSELKVKPEKGCIFEEEKYNNVFILRYNRIVPQR